jgi:hypothetical protein
MCSLSAWLQLPGPRTKQRFCSVFLHPLLDVGQLALVSLRPLVGGGSYLRAIALVKASRALIYSLLLLSSLSVQAGGILQIRNGYFWDPATQDYFVPRGIAYQTWNPPVGANQTFEQFDYDFVEFKKMYANSVRAEFVWNEVEKSPGVLDWSKPDHMVAKAEELGLKLFILVGFQYAPSWFPDDLKAINDQGQRSVVLNYEHPEARRAYSNYIYQAASRYKNSSAIGGWIVGNEYAYFDLWEPDHHFLGYDPYTQASFRSYLAALYTNKITSLNSNWGTAYTGFTNIVMPTSYPSDRKSPAWFDLLEWRKKSIGDYVAIGALAAKKADPNHLRTYSMVGGIFSGDDALNTCEDAKTIVARCAAAGAPLDFWSINNYAWASMGSELRSADYGIAKYHQISGLPVMISETGHTSTETLFPGAAVRQGKAIQSQLWESALSGAIGVHLFHWSDRELFGGVFVREKGFGIVNQDRTLKTPAYQDTLEAFRRMENLNLSRLLGGSLDPKPDVQFFWPLASDMGWPRANQENAMLWGALRRAGYQPSLLDDAQFARGDYTNAPALLLSRCFQMNPGDLDRIATNVIPSGIHVHANADLPGQVDTYQKPNTNWISRMSSLFGLNVANAVPGYDLGVTYADYHGTLNLTGISNLGGLTNGYVDQHGTWKIWHGITANSGTTVVTHTGNNGSQPALPALQIKNLGPAKTAINTFALADTFNGTLPVSDEHLWDIRYTWVRAIYRSHFGITPMVDLSGPGAQYVLPDYRICRNGSILLAFLNEHTNTFTINISSTNLLLGKTIENLTTGGIVETNSDGLFSLTISGDEYVLLYAYSSTNGVDASLVNPNSNKIWITDAPTIVWPTGTNYTVNVGFQSRVVGANLVTAFERVMLPNKTYGQSLGMPVSLGQGTVPIAVPIPDADPNDVNYVSSLGGGQYVFHAWLEKNGLRLCETYLPVRLAWGVHPLNPLPSNLALGTTYSITLGWQELPSPDPTEYPLPLSRADLWEEFKGSTQFFNVVLELRSGTNIIASSAYLTSTGTDQHTFSIKIPTNASGPLTWTSYLQAVTNASVDLSDSFENRGTGDDQNWLSPWLSYSYAQNNNSTIYAQGVNDVASQGNQGAFMIVQNPPDPGDFSGFGLQYIYNRDWALPHDRRLWTNFTFSAQFKDAHPYRAILELQLKDGRGGLINFTKSYTPGTNLWDTISASIDQFTIPSYVGHFDSSRVRALVINIQMLDSNSVYQGSIDNIIFNGPETVPVATPNDFWDSFEDRPLGADPNLLAPWGTYIYSEKTNSTFLAQGVSSEGADGGQTAFLVTSNAVNPGTFAGYGMFYIFSNEFALPANRSLWTNYTFSYQFREKNNRHCLLEMQVKSSVNTWVEFSHVYTPGPDGWDTFTASLNQFTQPAGVPLFQSNHVQAIAINIRMLDNGAIYESLLDNVFFNSPDQPIPNNTRYAFYTSSNDSLVDTDRDGIPDIYETGTGIYVSPTNTGTNPNKADTDGDGIPDGAEIIAGTNPNLSSDVLKITSITRNPSGHRLIYWNAKTNRIYALDYFDGSPFTGMTWLPLENNTSLTTPTNGLFHAIDTNVASPLRLYRLQVH